ncbi:MAG: hypothetical protein JWR26_2795 [Pedosphaera sp.]|nr:hypothetical protein [Pedosphaera sp.]
MKIILQHKHTHMYFVDDSGWTKAPSEARDFIGYDQAIAFAKEHRLSDVQIVLKFADHPYDIRLPFLKRLPHPAIRA